MEVSRIKRYAWLDTGTHGSLLDAGNFVRTLSLRQGMQSGCPEEIAYQNGWIDDVKMAEHIELFRKTDYGKYLEAVVDSSTKGN